MRWHLPQRPRRRLPARETTSHRQSGQPRNTSARHFRPSHFSQILFIISIFSLVLLQTSQQVSLLPAANPTSKLAPDGPSSGIEPAEFSLSSRRYIYPNSHHPRKSKSFQAAIKLESISSATSGGPISPVAQNLNAFRYELAEVGGLGGPPGAISDFNIQPEAAANHSGGHNRIKLIQEQIIQLRRQLESELGSASPMEGSKKELRLHSTACLSSRDCTKWIPRSQCNLDTLTCSCLGQHVELNSTTCLAPGLLAGECLVDAQCRQKVANSVCRAGLCACQDNFVPYRKDKCLPDRQCQLADKHSHCKWRIQNIYGTCACPPNYLAVTLPAPGSIGPRPAAGGTTTKCAPRLGDLCFHEQECLWATGNSTCRLPVSPAEAEGARWRSSLAPGAQLRCFCAPGFRESASRMRCLELEVKKDVKPEVETTTTTTVGGLSQEEQKRAFALLEKGLVGEYKKFMEFLSSSSLAGRRGHEPKTSTTTTLKPVPQEPAGGSNKTLAMGFQKRPEVRASSLGKSCTSRLECQLADKFSDCLGGLCECLRPSPRCSANSTGCHKDTFQCRNGQCISRFFVCDHFRNCQDGSDEEGCSVAGEGWRCPPEAFQCESGAECVPLGKLCDGKPDCRDGSDEFHCKPAQVAPVSVLATSAGFNNNNNNKTSGCPARAFACADGLQCLPGYAFCNAIAECADGSDENRHLCLGPAATAAGESPPKQTQQPELKDSTVIKTDRAVINELLRRQQLLRSQSRAGSGVGPRVKLLRRQPKLQGQFRRSALVGELNEIASGTGSAASGNDDAPAKQRANQQDCPEWAFACRNGKCRSRAILCSGVDGCGDNSDEDSCQVCQCEAP